MQIRREEFRFASPADGVALEGTYIFPEAPRGIVQFVHGMAEHRERYFDFMNFLAEHGFATVIHTHRGHGNCAVLGHFGKAGAEGLIADTKAVSEAAKKKFPGLPLFLFGHSMGCLVARCYLKRFDQALNGIFLCGTPYAAPAAIAGGGALIALKKAIHGDERRDAFVNQLMTGNFNKSVPDPETPNDWLSYNKQNVADYTADPLCGFCFTLNGFKGVIDLMKEAYSASGWACGNTDLPVVVLSGAEDPCHGGEKSFALTVRIVRDHGYPTESKLFENMRHEILNETGRETVWAYVLERLEDMAK